MGALAGLATVLALAGCGGGTHGASAGVQKRAGANGAAASGGKAASGSSLAQTSGPQSTSPPAATVGAARQAAKHLPTSVIATIAGHPIVFTEYRKVYGVEVRTLAAGGVPLDPPAFIRCAAGLSRQFERVQKGLPKSLRKVHIRRPALPSHGALIKECQARQRGLEQGAISQLIQQQWFELEAQAEGIHVSTASAEAAVAVERHTLGGSAAYARYLARLGETAQQAVARLRLGLIEERLQERRLGAPVAVSNREVSGYFAAHRAEFVIPGAKAPKLSTYQARIRFVLSEQARAQRAAAATTVFERRWRAQTTCRAGYIVPLCANSA